MTLTVVIGGTRSGKTAHAERLARAREGAVVYVATADAGDPATAERIAMHRAQRPSAWATLETSDDLAAALGAAALTAASATVIFDGLGVWIAGVLHRAGAFADIVALPTARATVERGVEELLAVEDLIVVTEDAGSGVLPADAASRAWLDLLGAATQRLADAADRVVHVIAGQPIVIKGARPEIPAELRHHGDRDVQPRDADHAVNVVAGGPPAWLRAALEDALDDTARYPDENAATAAVAALHDRSPDEVVTTNGAAEALWLLGPALHPRLAACVHPGFTEAEAGLRAHDVPVVRVQRDPDADFALDPPAVPDDADLVVLGNPASPSGRLDPAAAILALRRPGRTIVVDEAFMCLVPGEPGALAHEAHDDVIVVRSLTKALAVPGLRVGYALAPPPLAASLRAARPPWSANALTLAVLETAANAPDKLAAIAQRAQEERDDLARRLVAIDGLRLWPGAANYCLVAVADGPAVVARLRAQAIAVRSAASFPGLGPEHIRLTARHPEANARLAAALAEAIGVAA